MKSWRNTIIKRPEFRKDALVIEGRRPASFTPTLFGAAQGGTSGAQDEAVLQRETLEAARAQAEKLVAEAEARVEELEREACRVGYEEGLAQGLRAAEEAARDHLQRLAQLVDQAFIDRASMIRTAQDELIELSLAIAAKIIHREVAADPAVVLGMVESALERVPSDIHLRVVVNPLDADLVQASWDQMQGTTSFGTDWEILTDPRIERGGCILETRCGRIDSTIGTQLEQVALAFEAEE